jgi:hypothetical protein
LLVSLDELGGGISTIAISRGLVLLLRLDKSWEVSTRVGLVGLQLSRSGTGGDTTVDVLRAAEGDLGTIKTKRIQTAAVDLGATNGDAAEILVSSMRENMSQAAMRLYLRVRDLKLDSFTLSALLLALADARPNATHVERRGSW